MNSEAIERLRGWLRAARAGVVFTGAGISTESGIPDFRSPGGLWTQHKPIDFSDFVASEAMRIEAWRRRFAIDATFSAAQPNVGHRAIADWVSRGSVRWVITQNIDELHQRAGVAAQQVIELHGSTMYATCLDCGLRHELADVRVRFDATNTSPRCRQCGGLVKTATISFGQGMPLAEMRRAQAATEGCDLFIAMGSSLVVHPAAGFPVLAKRMGKRLVIINREPTELDPIADLVLHSELGPTLAAITQDA
jgi:NAD-dependent deacetylase